MLRSYHRVQEYSHHGALSEFPYVDDRPSCGGGTSSFIAVCLILAALVSGMAAGTAYLQGGAEEVVYRRAAEVRAFASAGWER